MTKCYKFILSMIFMVICSTSFLSVRAQSTLSAGDIAFTGYNSNSEGTLQNDFSFVLLTPISAGTTINFTDNGYKKAGSNALGTTEGTIVWTSSTAMARFSKIYIRVTPGGNGILGLSAGSIAGGFSNFILSQEGDQILAYQGHAISPTFISGIHMNTDPGGTYAAWDNIAVGTALTSNSSDVPPGLTNGVNAVMVVPSAGISESDNAKYNCTNSNNQTSVTALSSAINRLENWNQQDVTKYDLTSGCTFGVGVAPTVGSVSSSTANGTYKIDDVISIQVNFSAAVNVTGTPQLTLETGTTDRTINYASGSGTSTLSFSYTVQAGDISSDLDYTSTTALTLNGGTILSSANIVANLTLPSPGAANSLGANKAIVIDGVRPTVTISSSAASTTSISPIPVTVTFSENVTGFVAGDVTVTNGTLSGFSGSGTSYTFNITPSANGTVTVDVPANVAQDAAANQNTAATQLSRTYTAATITSITRLNPSPTATASVSYRIVFSTSISGITTSNFSVTATSLTGASISSVSGSGTTYTVTANTGTGSGTMLVNLANSTGITPTITNAPYTLGETYTITKSFAGSPQLTIAGTGGVGSDVTAFIDQVQVMNGGIPVANALQNGSFEQYDPLANGDFGYQPTNASWTFNAQAGIANDGSAFTPTTPIPNGIAVALIQSNGGSNGQIQQAIKVPTGSKYQIRFVTSQRICCTTLDQALNVFLNGVFIGNIQPGSNGYSTFSSALFSVTAPALTATFSTTASNPTSVSPIPVSVTFSQAVEDFVAADLIASNGTISGFTGNGANYTFNLTPSASGTVGISLAAGNAFDANNTPNTAASFSITYNQPTTASPVMTTPANGAYVASITPTYSGTAPSLSTVTIYVDGTVIGTTTASSGGTYSLTQPTALAQGSHTVRATAQTSGAAVSPSSNTNTFSVDNLRPTVVITSTATSPTSTSPIPFTVTFSESVTGFVAGDVTVGNGTISTVNGSGTTYTFNVTPTASGTVTVNVPANVAQDIASNGNTAASQLSITYNQPSTAAPELTTPANNTYIANTAPTYLGTAPASSTVTVYVDGTAIGTTTANGGTFSLTQPTALAQGSHMVYATAQTSGATVSANSNTNNFTVDNVRPAVTITSTTVNPTTTSPIPFTVTFSENVTGFVAGDVTVGNGNIGIVNGSGTTYTFNVTPIASGTVTVNVPANVAQDIASNGNTAASQFSITYEQPLPVTIAKGLEVKKQNDGIQLSWATASETNNKGFDIYRSRTGKQFNVLKTIGGKINSSSTQNYSYLDESPINGTNYYRLVQVDLDGKETIIGEKAIDYQIVNATLSVYPNPTTGKVTLAFAVNKYQKAQLISIHGQTLMEQNISAGTSQCSFDIATLPSGTYILQLSGTAGILHSKVIRK